MGTDTPGDWPLAAAPAPVAFVVPVEVMDADVEDGWPAVMSAPVSTFRAVTTPANGASSRLNDTRLSSRWTFASATTTFANDAAGQPRAPK